MVDLIVGLLPPLDVFFSLVAHKVMGILKSSLLAGSFADSGEIGYEAFISFVERVGVD